MLRTLPCLALILTAAILLLQVPALAQSPGTDSLVLIEQFLSFSEFPAKVSWDKEVPQVQEIHIVSSVDGTEQSALYYDSGSDREKPLLVALHSWSSDYRQLVSIPYGIWAVENDWVFIHPNKRGRYDSLEATASELAQQDVLDAVAYAQEHARIDPDRIYLAGFSGGAMTALVLAGRYPELWTAVSAWVPIYDLVDWYAFISAFPDRHYAGDIRKSCGGVPREGTAAARECRRRSPSSYLRNARGKSVRIHLACGIEDKIVPPDHSLRAFNSLADPADQFTRAEMRYIRKNQALPAHLQGEHSNPLYEKAGKKLIFERKSNNVTLSFFAGGHDILFNPILCWLSQQYRRPPE